MSKIKLSKKKLVGILIVITLIAVFGATTILTAESTQKLPVLLEITQEGDTAQMAVTLTGIPENQSSLQLDLQLSDSIENLTVTPSYESANTQCRFVMPDNEGGKKVVLYIVGKRGSSLPERLQLAKLSASKNDLETLARTEVKELTFVNDQLEAKAKIAAEAIVKTPDKNNDQDTVIKVQGNTVNFSEYTITASAGEGGTITPSGEVQVKAYEDQKFTVTAKEGYRINRVMVDGKTEVTLSEDGTYTFIAVNQPYSIEASFIPLGSSPDMSQNDSNSSQAGSGQVQGSVPATQNPPTGAGVPNLLILLLPAGCLFLIFAKRKMKN